MQFGRLAKISLLCILFWIGAAFHAVASEYHGQVTFGGLPVPGATVTATQGTNKVTAITDQGGVYSFDDLADGPWKIEVEMQCFTTIQADVTVVPKMPAAKWELKLLPVDQLMARTKVVQAPIIAQPILVPPVPGKKPETSASGNPAPDMPKPPDEQSQQASDGFLVNGSVNNAATSQFSLDQAFGNRRPNSKSLYTGGFSGVFNNSALDARTFSLSGSEAPKPFYNLMTGGFTIGGPVKIPHVMPRGPNFFVAYLWTRNQTAQTETGLVPTVAERTGDLSGLVNAAGQPITVYNPTTGLAYTGNKVPVSSQAQALLLLYPSLPNVTGNSAYNYQSTILNSTHQDLMQLHLDKTFGRKDQVYGQFNLQSTRASSINLFNFVDVTDSLGIRTNINWSHRFSQHLFFFTGYQLSRQRTAVVPNFDGRENVSGNAGISGNDQADPTDWGPPSLSFSSGIAGLSDANSQFNRYRTDAFNGSVAIYRGRHNITAGGDFRKQESNYLQQQNPRGSFTFNGIATQGTGNNPATSGSDLADFLIGVPDTSAISYGNADKYLRQPVFDAYFNDDWRIMSILTINVGGRWDFGAPITELKGRLANLDIAPGFTSAAPVLATNPVGSVTGTHYPSSLIRPDLRGFSPRIGISWRPIPASTVVVRAGYGIYDDTSVYQAFVLQLAQQSPFSSSLSVSNSASCKLTLAAGFNPCSSVTADTFAVDPNYHIGYAQTWQASIQRDLPAALQGTITYFGVKGTHGAQQFLPNTYPIGATVPTNAGPSGFVYRTSGGDSTRESIQGQLRRRLRSGFTASAMYTYSKSIDDDAVLGGQGYVASGSQGSSSASIAQNWLNPRAERSLSTFDQRQLLNIQAQYTSGEGLGGGSLMSGWRGRLLKEWTVLTNITYGSGLPETPIYPYAVPGTGNTSTIRPTLTGASIYSSGTKAHINVAAYSAPVAGQWGTAGRDSITGPGTFSLDSSLARTFRPTQRFYLDLRVDATNTLNHPVFSAWNTAWNLNNTQFGLPVAPNAMRSLQTTLRLRF